MSLAGLHDGGEGRTGYRLFYTPPPEEKLAELDFGIGETWHADGTEVLFGSTAHEWAHCSHHSSSQRDSSKRLDQSERTPRSEKRASKSHNQNPSNKFILQPGRSLTMAPSGRSRINFTSPLKAHATSSTNHLADGASAPSHLAISTLPNLEHAAASAPLPQQSLPHRPQVGSSLDILSGYTSSEEEEEVPLCGKEVDGSTESSRASKRSEKDKSHSLNSLELTAADGGPVSSIDSPRTRSRMSNELIYPKASKLQAKLPSPTTQTTQTTKQGHFSGLSSKQGPLHLSQKSGESLCLDPKMKMSGIITNRTSDHNGGKKRPASPKTPLKKSKRPKTKCGFVMSDESESEENDHDSGDDESVPMASAPSRPQERRLNQGADTGEVAPRALPPTNRLVNKSRLNMLLGRNKDARSPLLKSTQPSMIKTNITLPQVPTREQGCNQIGQHSKLTPGTSASQHQANAALKQGESPKGTVANVRQDQMRPSVGHLSSTASSQGSGKTLAQGSIVEKSGILEKPVNRAKDPHQQNSQIGTLERTGTSNDQRTVVMNNEDIGNEGVDEAVNVGKHSDAGKTTGSLPPQPLHSRGSGQRAVEKTKALSVVTSSKPSQITTGRNPLERKPTDSLPAQNRTAQQPQKRPDQASIRQPATQSQKSNRLAESSCSPQRAHLCLPQNQHPALSSNNSQSVDNRASNVGEGKGAHDAQKRKAENITGGPNERAAPVKKSVVTHKPFPVRTQPSVSDRKEKPKISMISSIMTEAAMPTKANKPPTRTITTQHAEFASSSNQGRNTTLQNNVSLSTPSASNNDKTVSKQSKIVPTQTTPPNQLQNIIAPIRNPKNSTRAKPSHASGKAADSQNTLSSSDHRAQGTSVTPRRASVKEFFAKKPATTPNPSVSTIRVDKCRNESSSDIRIVTKPPKELVPTVLQPSDIPLGACSSPIVMERLSVQKGPAKHTASDGSVTKSIPAAVLHPSFNPGATAQSEQVSNRNLSDLGATPEILDAKHSDQRKQQTSQGETIVESAALNATRVNDATESLEKEPAKTLSVSSTVNLRTVATQTDATAPQVASFKPSNMDVAFYSPTIPSDISIALNDFPSKDSEQSEPCFEYSVFQKLWSQEQDEEIITATEIAGRPFVNANEANSLAEQLFDSMREQYVKILRVEFSECSMKRDGKDCVTILGEVFLPYDYPKQTSYVKIWVERNYISKYASLGLQAIGTQSFVRKEAYALRLFKLVPALDMSDVESSDGAEPSIRVYHSFPCNEIYTTLDAANRAARSLQIELAHVKNPKDGITAKWQEQNLAELNAKVHALDPSMGGKEGCWKSEFNACGKGGDRLELIVEKAGIVGPRN